MALGWLNITELFNELLTQREEAKAGDLESYKTKRTELCAELDQQLAGLANKSVRARRRFIAAVQDSMLAEVIGETTLQQVIEKLKQREKTALICCIRHQEKYYSPEDYSAVTTELNQELMEFFTATKASIIDDLVDTLCQENKVIHDGDMGEFGLEGSAKCKEVDLVYCSVIQVLLAREFELMAKMSAMPGAEHLSLNKTKLIEFAFGSNSLAAAVLAKTFAQVAPKAFISFQEELEKTWSDKQLSEIKRLDETKSWIEPAKKGEVHFLKSVLTKPVDDRLLANARARLHDLRSAMARSLAETVHHRAFIEHASHGKATVTAGGKLADGAEKPALALASTDAGVGISPQVPVRSSALTAI